MRAAVIAGGLLVLAGCATSISPPGDMRVSPTLDPARFYAGTWYEIGRRPMALTSGCVAGGTTYALEANGKVRALDFCHDGSPAGALKKIGGPAHILDPGANARLHVSYRLFGFLRVPRDYRVLDRAEDYTWFISADPSFLDLWLYTREPHPSDERVATLVSRAKALGYDVGLLEFPATSP